MSVPCWKVCSFFCCINQTESLSTLYPLPIQRAHPQNLTLISLGRRKFELSGWVMGGDSSPHGTVLWEFYQIAPHLSLYLCSIQYVGKHHGCDRQFKKETFLFGKFHSTRNTVKRISISAPLFSMHHFMRSWICESIGKSCEGQTKCVAFYLLITQTFFFFFFLHIFFFSMGI